MPRNRRERDASSLFLEALLKTAPNSPLPLHPVPSSRSCVYFFLFLAISPACFLSLLFLRLLFLDLSSLGRRRTLAKAGNEGTSEPEDGRTELILGARKAKGGPTALEFHGALAITSSREGDRPGERAFCNRLLNIRQSWNSGITFAWLRKSDARRVCAHSLFRLLLARANMYGPASRDAN